MLHALKCFTLLYGFATIAALGGCRTMQAGGTGQRGIARHSRLPPVRRVVCLYDQRPWLNLDAAGDRDPEGIQYRVFLDVGKGKGVLRDGFFRIEMYRIDPKAPDKIERTLVSDWEYPTSAFQQVKSKVLGMGYHLRLRWARKDIAGHEVELITHYRDPAGRVVRSGTKRLRVPQYTS